MLRKEDAKKKEPKKEEQKQESLREAGWKQAGYFLLGYLILAFLFYLIAEEQILYRTYPKEPLVQSTNIGEIVDGDVIEQIVEYSGDYLSSLTFPIATYARKNTGTIEIAVSTKPFGTEIDSNLIIRQTFDMEKMEDNSDLTIKVGKQLESSVLYLRITSYGATYGNAVTFYAGSKSENDPALFRNGQAEAMSLCVRIEGGIRTFFGVWYWEIVLLTGVILAISVLFLFWKGEKNRLGNRVVFHIRHYGFLVNQLVKRDFKTKYKRSTLGFLWSFLNPLLTMIVQYIVFSTIFRSDIDNFPVYLLSAGIVFNFFTESVGGGLCAIVGNASLITKVYVPKYIYPFSKVLSTAINLVISMLPLLLAVWITGEEITTAFFLIPFLFLCLILFCVGMSFLLSTSMVFFRDTQFLWGIISLVWMYATPIFYPESIIPEHFSFILKGNPMYHYLKFFRTILMQGVSPQMSEYVYCIGFALLFLLIGAGVFHKAQNKFVLYL